MASESSAMCSAAAAPVSNGPQRDSAGQPQQLYRVPAYAAWFRHDSLHAQELRGLPEYFVGSTATKSPRVPLLWHPVKSLCVVHYPAHVNLVERMRTMPE